MDISIIYTLYKWMLLNRDIIDAIATLIIVLSCVVIVLRTDRLFKISFHPGIRYFRNSFFFYGVAFLLRYIVGILPLIGSNLKNVGLFYCLINIFFEYFMMVSGFLLFYSLLWKKFEENARSYSSIFNAKISIFYSFAFVLCLLDYLWQTHYFMFISQILIFFIALIIVLVKMSKSGNKSKTFGFLYFFVILLNLTMWILSFIIAYFFKWYRPGVITVNALYVIIFFLLLYSVWIATRINKEI